METRHRDDKGVVLLTSTILLFTLMALGSAFLLSSIGNARYTRQQAELARAAALAQAGADLAVYDITYGTKTIGDTWAEIELGGGTVRIFSEAQTDNSGNVVANLGRIFSEAEVNGAFSLVEVTIQHNPHKIHELYFKAIYAGNASGLGGYRMDFTGVNHQRSSRDQTDSVDGDVHIEGDIALGSDASAHRFGDLDATGRLMKLDEFGEFKNFLGGGGDDPLLPPNMQAQGYDRSNRQYKAWDSEFQGPGRDVIHVGDEFQHYGDLSMLQQLRIAQEGGYFSPGGYDEWNTSCTALPDESLANFFHKGYQNHFADTFTASDDSRISATENYYLGQRNGGTAGSYGDRHGLYGGGHSVITITEEMNNKVYYVEGNLWLDSDGDNHLFIVPGEGVERVNISIVVEGNIFIGDQVFVTTNSVDDQQFNRNIGGSTGAEAYSLTDPESGIALIAMADGESYNDVNKNGKYDVGETIIGRSDPNTPSPAQQNPSAPGTYTTDYQGRMEGSGNIVFGDTISGPVGVVEAFMFAENNFCDITADTSYSNQNPYIFGNMTAGNHVYLNRYTDLGWLDIKPVNNFSPPAGWVQIDGAWYPEGTTAANKDNPFVTYHKVMPGTWESTITTDYWGRDTITYVKKSDGGWTVMERYHNPLNLTYDQRLENGVINIPGLPSSIEEQDGNWTIVVWKQRDGRRPGWNAGP